MPRRTDRSLSTLLGTLPLMALLAWGAPAALAQAAAGGVIVPGENLVVEGVPPVPAAIAEATARYTESRQASFAGWHPERAEMLIATRFGATSQLHRVAAPGGAREQLTFFAEPVGGGSFAPRGGGYVVFARDRGGDEFAQLYRLDVASGRVTLLTDGGRSQNGGVRWSRDGARIAYASTRRNGADRDLYVMDPEDPASDRRVMEARGGGWGVLDWSPDSRLLAVSEYRAVTDSDVWLLEIASGERRRLTARPEGVRVAYRGGTFTPDGAALWLTSDQDSEFQRLGLLSVATGAFTPVTTDLAWDVEGFAVSSDGARVAFTVNEAGRSRLYLLDAATRAYAPAGADLPVGVIGGLEWHADGRTLGFTLSSARIPGDAFSLDAETGRLTRWTRSELGGLRDDDLAEAEPIAWRSFDGREITGFAFRPDPARHPGPRPVIVQIHGGPEAQARPTFLGRNAYLVGELGVTIIQPNVRGSTGFGKTFVSLDDGLRRMDAVRDIEALLDWIAAQPDLDAGRVLVTGGSYGGFMTLAVATNYDARICCAINIVGISDFRTFLQNTESYRRDLRRAEYGDERDPEIAAFFERISPLGNAGRITRPLFIIQGGNDPRVPLSEAEQMRDRVRQNGTPVWYLMATDEGHGFRKKPNVDFQFYSTVLFIRRYLLGEDV
ncbi:MAG: prolyl oligopeptidase family serine peptidase [Rubricoccaceae bacterium]